jgi:hypothetical protein
MKRFRLAPAVVAALIGLVTALVFAGTAGAFHTKNPSETPALDAEGSTYQGFDPMETSIPYLAWRGEEVRLVKCFDPDDFRVGELATAEWQVMDWSGDDHVWPKFFDDLDQETGWARGRGDQGGRQCFAIDITSHKPGIAIVKMSVDGDDINLLDDTITPLDPGGNSLVGEGDPVAKHQFVVIWMTLDTPILRCLEADTDVSPSGCPGAGPVTENPRDTNRLGVLVKGLVPLNEQFRTELGAQDSDLNASQIKFPDIWDDLARTSLNSISRGLFLANDGNRNNDPVNPNGPERDLVTDQIYDEFWDIHDSTGPFNSGVYGPDQPERVTDICPGVEAANHLAQLNCHVRQIVAGGDADCNGTNPLTVNDTVDNCDRGEFSVFSRVFHDVSGPPTIGPYSPTRPDETMLSDSVTNLNDAPMPAALVKASIAPNTGGDDIGGVGSLESVDKHLVPEYNRGGPECRSPNNPDDPHCLTAPFYGAYIPPSPNMENNANAFLRDDPDTASGIHGSFANNFEGYLPVRYPRVNGTNGLYHYWDIVEVRRQAVATETDCVRPPDPREPENQVGRPTPSGPQEIVLYTDEHGEAQFLFDAGVGFFFDNFIVDETQRSCLPVGLLGTADISVQARYPFQPLTNAGTTSNTLQKRIQSLFHKGIICVPKPGEEGTKILCVAFARDIDGSPIIGERVCVIGIGATLVRTFIISHQEGPIRDNTACGRTHQNNDEMEDLGTDEFPTIDDSYGIETFLVVGTGPVTIIADFVDERLEFEVSTTIPPSPGTVGAQVGTPVPSSRHITPVPVPGAGLFVAPNGTTQTNNNATQNRQLTLPVLKPKKAAKASLVFVRIVKPLRQGAMRSVVLRVKSSKKVARVQLQLIKRGKVMGTVIRKVKTNRTVRVPNLRVPKAVTNVRVKVIA